MFAPMEIIRGLISGERLKHPIPSMDGALSPNSRLDALPTLELTLKAPDDIQDDGEGGLLIAQGGQLLHRRADGDATPLAAFDQPISAFTRLADGTLMIGEDGVGLHHLDATGQRLASCGSADGYAFSLKAITAIAEDPVHGGVYFTVGTTRHTAGDWVRDLMECNHDGLIGYWSGTDSPARILRSGLAYPNGLLVEHNGRQLVITESWTHSVTRYPITEAGLGAPHTLIGNMPGYPARIAPAAGGGYWLAAFAMRTHLVELILGEKAFKHDMMNSLDPELWIRPALSSTGSHLEPLQMGAMKKLGIRKPWAPPRSYGLVIRVGEDGEPVESLHSRVDGHYHGITAAREIGGRLYIVSKGNDQILIAPLTSSAGSPA